MNYQILTFYHICLTFFKEIQHSYTLSLLSFPLQFHFREGENHNPKLTFHHPHAYYSIITTNVGIQTC